VITGPRLLALDAASIAVQDTRMDDDPKIAKALAKIPQLPLDVRRALREVVNAKRAQENPSEAQRKADLIDINGPRIAALLARGPCTDPTMNAWTRSMMLAYGEGIRMATPAANDLERP
jgi:hypothetical protein